VVVLAAIDLGFLRWVEPLGGPNVTDAGVALMIATPIMLNVLGVCVFLMIRALVRLGECGPALCGFFVAGMVAMIVVTVCTMIFPDPIFDPIVAVIQPLFEPFKERMSGESAEVLATMIVSVVLTVPQLVFALIGGLLNRRLGGFTVVTGRRLRRMDATDNPPAVELARDVPRGPITITPARESS
jgi:hypothetical protein